MSSDTFTLYMAIVWGMAAGYLLRDIHLHIRQKREQQHRDNVVVFMRRGASR